MYDVKDHLPFNTPITWPIPPTLSLTDDYFVCIFQKRVGGGIFKVEFARSRYHLKNFVQAASHWAKEHGWRGEMRYEGTEPPKGKEETEKEKNRRKNRKKEEKRKAKRMVARGEKGEVQRKVKVTGVEKILAEERRRVILGG